MLTSSGVCATCALSRAQRAVASTVAGHARLCMIGRRGAAANAEAQRHALALRLPGVSWELWKNVLHRCAAAKRRCTAPQCASYKDYGGRGIQFRFSSVRAMAIYLLGTLGPPPEGFEVDRRDNDGHYEEGNLRWVDNQTQNSNKRKYRRWHYGARMDALMRARPDYTYEGLRRLINMGWSDDRIMQHRKGSHVRHS